MSALSSIASPRLARTLTLRLVVTTMLVMCLQAGIVSVRDYFAETDFLSSYVRREAQKIARGISDPDRMPSQYAGPDQAAYAFRVIDAEGRVLSERNSERLTAWIDNASIRQDFWMRKLHATERMHVAGGLRMKRDGNHIWVDIATFGDPAGTYVSNIAADILDDVWVPLLPLGLLTMLVSAISVSRSLRPLVDASARADAIAVLERGERFDVGALPEEASHFASAINRLLDRVADLVAAQRMFIARAAHELRTPLSIMMLELGHLKDTNSKRLEADVRAMSEIVDQLLVLARLESTQKPQMRPVDLSTVLRELVGRMIGWAEKDGHKLSYVSRLERPILGDEPTLRDAVRNLIENAVKHTPSGTEIRVEVSPDATIVVEDNGPGLGALTPEELLQPFRKGSTSSSGAGLGLTIVRQSIEMHGGSLEIGRSSRGGARFVLRLPERQLSGFAVAA